MKKLLFGLVFCASLAISCIGFAKTTLAWTDITGSLNGTEISDLVQATDGSIYACGNYYDELLVQHAKIWKYSNSNWTDITGNLSGANVGNIIEALDGTLYVSGVDNGYVPAVWNYTNGSWNDVTSNLDAYEVLALMQAADGTIYAGGDYTVDYINYFAKVWQYNGSVWTDITDSNLVGYRVDDLMQARDGSIYASGTYYNEPQLKFNSRIWQYTGVGWNNVTGNLGGSFVYSMLQMDDGAFYLGGSDFDFITQTAKVWKGGNNSWQDMSLPVTGTNSAVNKLLFLGDIVYASGYDDDVAHTATVWTFSNNTWNSEILGQADDHTAAWTMLLGTNGFYVGGYVDLPAKVWWRDYTMEEWRIISENKLIAGEQITLRSALDEQTIAGQSLNIFFKNLPNKLTKNNAYWMTWQKYNAYPRKWKSAKKTALKRYWKLTTNLNKYKAKKSSQKFKVKVTFKYTKKLFKALKKKNSAASKANLTLKYRNKKTSWKKITSVFTDAKLIKKNKKMIVKYFTHFPKKTQYFAIGLK
ncbi:MAG: hypothetical protein WC663_04870 [Patescibacteria group bacterium]|jgi:hypothetical protein